MRSSEGSQAEQLKALIDLDLATYFQGQKSSFPWVEIDLGTWVKVKQVLVTRPDLPNEVSHVLVLPETLHLASPVL